MNIEKSLLNYPRPLLRRDSFIDLNGEWDFLFDDLKQGEVDGYFLHWPNNSLKINVPYCYQAEASGIYDTSKHEVIWYHRFIDLHNEDLNNKRVILHIDAIDYESKIFVNGLLVGEHKGGYNRVSLDITESLHNSAANIVIRSLDTYDTHQPRGKQKYKDEAWGCWYQEVNGIWKSVWLEIVSPVHIETLKMTANEEKKAFDFETRIAGTGILCTLKTSVYFKGTLVGENITKINGDKAIYSIPLSEVHYWNVDTPDLYDVKYELYNSSKQFDVVTSQIGFRTIKIDGNKILINNKNTFLRLALEQGYYKKGIYTATMDELIEEVNWIKRLGFNGIRMHQKLEDERFYYLCDLMGIYVWCEMPSCYDFDQDTVDNTIREWKEAIRQYYNHTSIIVWTPINESWGVPGIRTEKEQQLFLEALYTKTKSYDHNRPVVSNDGWEHCITDLVTLHNYVQDPSRFKEGYIDPVMDIVLNNKGVDDMNSFIPFAYGYSYTGQPILYDEFCGIGYNVESTDKGWGYGTSTETAEAFFNRYKGLVKAATESKDLAGWCMTQLTDVYIEVNGLLTMDRKPKYDVEKLKAVNEGRFDD